MIRMNLAKGELQSIAVQIGDSIGVETGVLWLTLEGSQKDVILRAGQRWTAESKGQIMLQALKSANYSRSMQVSVPSVGALQTLWRSLSHPTMIGS